jgi:hypothetical protein
VRRPRPLVARRPSAVDPRIYARQGSSQTRDSRSVDWRSAIGLVGFRRICPAHVQVRRRSRRIQRNSSDCLDDQPSVRCRAPAKSRSAPIARTCLSLESGCGHLGRHGPRLGVGQRRGRARRRSATARIGWPSIWACRRSNSIAAAWSSRSRCMMTPRACSIRVSCWTAS